MATVPGLLSTLEGFARYLGRALIALGVLAMLAPVASGALVMVLLGLVLFVAGVLLTLFGWQAWAGEKGPLGFVIGGLTLVCALTDRKSVV